MVKTASREGVGKTRHFTGGEDTIFEGVADRKTIVPSGEDKQACPIHSRIDAASPLAPPLSSPLGAPCLDGRSFRMDFLRTSDGEDGQSGKGGEDTTFLGWWRHDFRGVADEKTIGPSGEDKLGLPPSILAYTPPHPWRRHCLHHWGPPTGPTARTGKMAPDPLSRQPVFSQGFSTHI